MNNLTYRLLLLTILFPLLFLNSHSVNGQNQPEIPKQKSDFWNKVQFGGGLGLSFGSNYTDVSIAPGAVYNFNQYVGLGLGLQYNYIKNRDYYRSDLYGGSVVGLFNPIPQIQLSAELEQLRANVSYGATNLNPAVSDDFWSTGLFVGAGYRAGSATIGARYNLLQNTRRNVYSEAFMPFVRVYF